MNAGVVMLGAMLVDVLEFRANPSGCDRNSRSDDQHQQTDQEKGVVAGIAAAGRTIIPPSPDRKRQRTRRAVIAVKHRRGYLHHVAADAHAGQNHDARPRLILKY